MKRLPCKHQNSIKDDKKMIDKKEVINNIFSKPTAGVMITIPSV